MKVCVFFGVPLSPMSDGQTANLSNAAFAALPESLRDVYPMGEAPADSINLVCSIYSKIQTIEASLARLQAVMDEDCIDK